MLPLPLSSRSAINACSVFLLGIAFLQGGCSEAEKPVFDGDSAFRFLTEQCEIGPRYPGSRGHKELRRYLVRKLRSYGANVSAQAFDAVLTSGDTLHLANIIANYNTGSPRRILLGAHYDTRPYADRDPDPANRDKPIIGANDGASGVAVLLETARLLGGSSPPVGVDLVFFDGEDYGREGVQEDYILGSSHFASNMREYSPGAVVIVDMIGEKDLRIKKERFSARYSGTLLEEIFSIAALLEIEAFVDEQGPSILDDHIPFINRGIPAVNLIDFDYPYWHTLEDTPDKCSAESLEAVGRVIIHYIWSRQE
jgi:Zn-dependent M28 family amino/carboxypeptidase